MKTPKTITKVAIGTAIILSSLALAFSKKADNKIMTENAFNSQIPSTKQYSGQFFDVKNTFNFDNSPGSYEIKGKMDKEPMISFISYSRILNFSGDAQKDVYSLWGKLNSSKTSVYAVDSTATDLIAFKATTFGNKIDTTYDDQKIIFADQQLIKIIHKDRTISSISDWDVSVSGPGAASQKAEDTSGTKSIYSYTITVSKNFSTPVSANSITLPTGELNLASIIEREKMSISFTSVAAAKYSIVGKDTTLPTGIFGQIFVRDTSDVNTKNFMQVHDPGYGLGISPKQFFLEGALVNYKPHLWYLSDKNGATSYITDGKWHAGNASTGYGIDYSTSNRGPPNYASPPFIRISYDYLATTNFGPYPGSTTEPMYRFVSGGALNDGDVYNAIKLKKNSGTNLYEVGDSLYSIQFNKGNITLMGKIPFDGFINDLGFRVVADSSRTSFKLSYYDNDMHTSSALIGFNEVPYKKDMKYYDFVAPTVTNVIPFNNAKDVPRDTKWNVTFSEQMEILTLTRNNFTVTSQSGTNVHVNIYYAGTTATVTPDSLDYNTTYTLTVKGVTDLAGNKLKDTFTSTATTMPDTTTDVPWQQVKENPYGITIFPNPAQEFVSLKFEQMPEGRVDIKIFNEYGQQVKRIYNGEGQDAPSQIPINDLSNGIYAIVTTIGDTRVTNFFVKTK